MESNSNNDKQPSIKEYLDDSYKFESTAKIISITNDIKDNNLVVITLDKTIFHPQGGGQPSDEGYITQNNDENKNSFKLVIKQLVYDRLSDEVYHLFDKAEFEKTNLKVNDTINLHVDAEKRKLYAKLHSAGHLLDISVSKIGLELIPGKGYHFPDVPYVEYQGKIDKTKTENILESLQKATDDILSNTNQEDKAIVKLYEYKEGKEKFGEIPSYLPVDKPFRWIQLNQEDKGCPCGGTHVKHVKDINQMKITKISNKGKVVRISYLVN